VSALLRWTVGTVIAGSVIVGILMPKAENDLFRNERQARTDSLWNAWISSAEQTRLFKRVVDRAEAREIARALPPVRAEAPLIRIDPRIGRESEARLRRRFEDEVREAGGATPRHPLAFVVRIDSTNPTGIYLRAVALPERAGDPCTIVMTVPFNLRNTLFLVATQRLLGTCAFYAAHGAPGPEVERWLRDTRIASAQYIARPSAFAGDTVDLKLRMRWYGFTTDAASLARCRAGAEDACLRFLSPDPATPAIFEEPREGGAALDRTPLATVAPGTEVFQSGSWGGDLYLLRGAILGTMATELGPERFGALWRDSRPLEESFRAFEGRTLGAWVAEYVAERTEPYAAGPGLRLLPILLSLALVLGAMLLGIFRSPRRQT
jgi:hypothetical protein